MRGVQLGMLIDALDGTEETVGVGFGFGKDFFVEKANISDRQLPLLIQFKPPQKHSRIEEIHLSSPYSPVRLPTPHYQFVQFPFSQCFDRHFRDVQRNRCEGEVAAGLTGVGQYCISFVG